MNIDKSILSQENLDKLLALDNAKVLEIIEKYVTLLKPDKVTIITDDQKDIDYIRELSIKKGEEHKLAMEGHTIHWDGYNDQARDKKNTRVLVTPEMKMSKKINTIPRDEGLSEVLGLMDGIMKGKEALVRFFCLGPLDSRFSISALQITDSTYVCHSEDILYRSGYEQFKKTGSSEDFFTIIHSAGETDARGNSVNLDKRRIYMDLKTNHVFTCNNQYAGNSVGLKKLALRLAINKANNEDWLTEHMFIMGFHPEGRDRVTYFTGAYPSACGKTSTAMVSGQSIIGDDIAYLRMDESDGLCHAVNVEQGIFGIITDVNAKDDPVIWDVLHSPREIIFSNVLESNGKPYWLNSGQDVPDSGRNHFSDTWKRGMKDSNGNEVGHAHKNSRYTVRIRDLENADPNLNNPAGVPIHGIIYGGRDSDTSVPVYQSIDWKHGVSIGATIESETTAATLGAEGVRAFSPMANLDFLVVPLGKYIQNHFDFGAKLKKAPLVFSTNYFQKVEGRFLTDKLDKKVWLMWMEGRVHGEYEALETPIGYIPVYEDIKDLFKQVFDKDYSMINYEQQFTINLQKYIEKLDRMAKIYGDELDIPEDFTRILTDQKQRCLEAKEFFGTECVKPTLFAKAR
jgi:phosphoenolpyruvate carboxykinase (GTP)